VTASASETVVITDRGAVEGVVEGATVAFRGIPYVAPPVGELRFRPPVDHACWEETRSAVEFGPVCPQLTIAGAFEGDEDCLTLNVSTPAADGAARPVLFFIHGGGNIQGSASEPIGQNAGHIYDGRHLAEERDVVVVTIQYRLGAMGFLTHAGLDTESAVGVSGNYGVRDQIAALEWVQRNIAAFGGDPGRVMIFGESAGAVNTCTLLTSPLAAGLFHAALMQSGGCRQADLALAETSMKPLVDDSVCGPEADPIACLRGLSSEELVRELPGSVGVFDVSPGLTIGFGPVVDGVVLLDSPEAALAAGDFEPVPFAVGANAEELAKLIDAQVDTDAEYVAAVELAMAPYGQQATDDALVIYPSAAYPSPQAALVALLSDQRFVCPSRRIARAASGHGSPVYRYFFQRQAQTAMGSLPAQHGIELLYVFGTMLDIPGFVPAPADADLGVAMRGYWSTLLGGAPSADGQPAWPLYDPALDTTLVLDANVAAVDGIRTTECDFWDGLALPP
jgi:para-nitrobenzyl esterase